LLSCGFDLIVAALRSLLPSHCRVSQRPRSKLARIFHPRVVDEFLAPTPPGSPMHPLHLTSKDRRSDACATRSSHCRIRPLGPTLQDACLEPIAQLADDALIVKPRCSGNRTPVVADRIEEAWTVGVENQIRPRIAGRRRRCVQRVTRWRAKPKP